MINKFKNIFKSKNEVTARPTNRDLEKVLENQLEELIEGAQKALDDKVDAKLGDDLSDKATMDPEIKEGEKESSKGNVELSKYTVAEFNKNITKERIPTGEYKLEELVTQTVKQFAVVIIKKGIRLDYDNLDTTIVTNKEVMLFILQEVISNAINHIPTGELKIYLLNNELLVIEDNGIGIPAEELPKIFEEGFVGSKSPNKDTAEGIGLFKAAIALEKMGYPYEVQTAEGFGTGFAIKIK